MPETLATKMAGHPPRCRCGECRAVRAAYMAARRRAAGMGEARRVICVHGLVRRHCEPCEAVAGRRRADARRRAVNRLIEAFPERYRALYEEELERAATTSS